MVTIRDMGTKLLFSKPENEDPVANSNEKVQEIPGFAIDDKMLKYASSIV